MPATRQRTAQSYQLTERARQATNRRWLPEERRVVEEGISAGYEIDEIHGLLPHRTRKAVMLIMYEIKGPQDRDEPASLCDARREKDAAEGSAALLEAMVRVFGLQRMGS